MFSRILFFAISVLVLLVLTDAVSAFEISAYYDPISIVIQDYYRGGSQLGQCSLAERLTSIANNEDVLNWYDEMGITILCTSYDQLSQFQNLSNHHFRVMNNIYLEGSYRYLEAQA